MDGSPDRWREGRGAGDGGNSKRKEKKISRVRQWVRCQCDCVNEWCSSPGRIVKNSRVNVLTPESRFLFLLLLAYYFLLFFFVLLLLQLLLLLIIFLHLFLPLLLILLLILLPLLLSLLRGWMEGKKMSLTVHWHTDQNGKEKKRKVLVLIWQFTLS